MTWTGRRITQGLGLPNNPPALGPAQGAIGTMTSILMGMVIVSLWGDYRTAKANVAAEAIEIRSLVREASLLPQRYRDDIIRDLHLYIDAVVADEWPAMAAGGFANTAGKALLNLGADALEAPRDRIDVRPRVARIAELRAARLGQTSSGITPVLWFALLVIPLMLLASFAFVNDANATFHYILVTLVGLALAIALFVALEVDLPYQGEALVRPDLLETAIQSALTDQGVTLPAGAAKHQRPSFDRTTKASSAGSP